MGRPTPPQPADHKRRDIQGLRAVAVLLVALNHAGVPGLPGGFVGVDVFYVVSGFVITQSLLSRGTRQRISISDFYAARARRILPMSTLVLVVTVIASWKLLAFDRAQRVVTDAIWAGLFGANYHFSATGTDYFASTLPQSPLQHYWSLAVEEQFYLVWPLLLSLIVFGVTKRSRRRAARRGLPTGRIMVVLAVIIAASLLWSIRQTEQLPIVAFFSTFTRAWELGVGAALAVGVASLARIPELMAAALTWAGVGGVVASAIVITSSTPFPGWAALLPVLSTAAIIAGGTPNPRGGASVALKLPPLQSIGNASFSFYLWHWPILIIAEGHAGHALSLSAKLILLAGALALSFVTYRIIETPFRLSEWLNLERLRSLALWPIAISVLIIVCSLVTISIDADLRSRVVQLSVPAGGATLNPADTTAKVYTSKELDAAVVASAALAQKGAPIPGGLSPSVDKIDKDFDSLTDCVSHPPTTTGPSCIFGDRNAKRSVVVTGDSHALQWMPAFDAIGKAKGWAVIPMIKIYCIAADKEGGMNAAQTKECTAWQKWMVPTVNKLHPNLIVISNFMQGNRVQSWQDGLTGMAKSLQAPGTTVALFSDPPGLTGDPGPCLLKPGATMKTCTTTLNPVREEMRQAAEKAAVASGAKFVDLYDWFCAGSQCPAVIGNTVAYKDFQHVSKTYSLQVADALGRRLNM